MLGRGGVLNVCLLHFGSVAFSWLRGGAVCSVHSTELNWTWHRIAHSATGYSDKKRHNWRTHISLYSFQMHCALRTVYWNYIQVRGEVTRNAERWCTTIYSLQCDNWAVWQLFANHLYHPDGPVYWYIRGRSSVTIVCKSSVSSGWTSLSIHKRSVRCDSCLQIICIIRMDRPIDT